MTRSRRTRVFLVTSAALAAWLAPPALAAAPGTNVLVSRPPAFGPLSAPTTNHSFVAEGDDSAGRVVSDEDGHRYVAFMSGADGLSDADDDRVSNVFVRDRLLGVTILVSRADGPAGAGANANSGEPAISADGRWVAFHSRATNLAAGTSGLAEHVYVRDLVLGTTRLVDRADGLDGAIADGSSFDGSLTVVGGNPVVAFASSATNLDGATNDRTQVYVRRVGSNDTEMASRPDGSATVAGNDHSALPSISTDATSVAFQSSATNLGDAAAGDDVLIRKLASDDTLVASMVGANGDSGEPSISANGNRVAFTSTSTNLHPDDTDSGADVYVRQVSPLTLVIASRAGGSAGALGNGASSQPVISDDGNAVVFKSASGNLTIGDTNGVSDVFLRTSPFAASPSTSLVSRPSSLAEADGPSERPSISRTISGSALNNNHLVAFTTAADNMGADDENDFVQVYARVTGVTISPNPAIYVSRPTGAAPFRSGVNASHLRSPERSSENVASMSGDGRFTVFLSAEDDLAADDDDRFVNVYRRDNLTGETILVSRANGAAGAAADGNSGAAGDATVPQPSGAPAISSDGNRIAFASAAGNLAPDDSNGFPDVFVRDVAAGTTELASRTDADAVMTLPSGEPAISGDGSKVAFATLFPGDPMDGNSEPDVYLRDLSPGTTKLISRKGAAGPAGNKGSTSPAIDADGSHVAFATSADDFSAIPDGNAGSDIWVRDVAAGQVTLVSRALAANETANASSFAPAISADGNRIAFSSIATNLVAGVDVNGGSRDVFVRDVAAATTALVSATADANGISGNGGSERASIDASGTRIAFETFANDLVPGDVNGAMDVLVRDTTALTTELVSRGAGPAGVQSLRSSGTPSISGNGDCVAFETTADDLVPMPPGTDHARVLARALRGDCPFGPLPEPPAPPGPPPGPPAVSDTTAPVLSAVSVAPRRFLAGRRVRPRTRTRPAIGARLRFTLSEAATVTIRIDALVRGRRLNKRCVAPRRSPRGRACTRVIKRGTLTHAGTAGANRFALTGRLRGRRLPPGRYRATLRGRDAAGNVSAPSRVGFTVLRPR
jgi:Tol biopolymer transport system component